MNAGQPAPRALWLALGFALLLGAALMRWWAKEPPPARPPDLDDWDIPRLLRHLENRGLHLRPIATLQKGPIAHNLYLTCTGQGWVEVDGLLKAPAQIDRWRGTVYCEMIFNPVRRMQRLDQWGDCGLGVGPFVFFGDRALLRQIRDALIAEHPP